jgi:two-component system, NarL family, response regulator DevR
MFDRRPIRVFLLDDHEIVRQGVRGVLEAAGDIEVVGEARTRQEATRRALACRPDVALLDVRLPDGNGVQVCRELRSRRPELRCVMLTSFDDDQALLDAIVAGACGYVLKEVRAGALVDSVRRVANGESLLDPYALARVVERLRDPTALDPLIAALSAQERRILSFLAESQTNRQIAEQMFLAEKTVKNYVSNVLVKLGMHGRIEAAVYATKVAERTARRATASATGW